MSPRNAGAPETPVNRLEAAYHEHGAALLAYLRRHFSVVGSADDLLQETFVQALRTLDRAAEVVSLRAWLFGIARNVAVTAARRRRDTVRLSETIAVREPEAADPRIDRMQQAITRLPEAQREALELRVRDDLSYDEIADVLGIPVGTVRSRLHNAMRMLKESLT